MDINADMMKTAAELFVRQDMEAMETVGDWFSDL